MCLLSCWKKALLCLSPIPKPLYNQGYQSSPLPLQLQLKFLCLIFPPHKQQPLLQLFSSSCWAEWSHPSGMWRPSCRGQGRRPQVKCSLLDFKTAFTEGEKGLNKSRKGRQEKEVLPGSKTTKRVLKIHLEKRVLQCFCLALLFLSLQIKTRKPLLQFPLAKCFHSKNHSHFQDYTRLVSFSGCRGYHKHTWGFNLNSILEIWAPLQPKCNSVLLLKDYL